MINKLDSICFHLNGNEVREKTEKSRTVEFLDFIFLFYKFIYNNASNFNVDLDLYNDSVKVLQHEVELNLKALTKSIRDKAVVRFYLNFLVTVLIIALCSLLPLTFYSRGIIKRANKFKKKIFFLFK